MTHDPIPHLSTEEIDLWAQGLLGAARTMHLPDCSLCLAEAERERKLLLAFAQLPRFGPATGFADRVMAQVKVPTPSGEFQS
jgi:hypothetical protein